MNFHFILFDHFKNIFLFFIKRRNALLFFYFQHFIHLRFCNIMTLLQSHSVCLLLSYKIFFWCCNIRINTKISLNNDINQGLTEFVRQKAVVYSTFDIIYKIIFFLFLYKAILKNLLRKTYIFTKNDMLQVSCNENIQRNFKKQTRKQMYSN